MSAYTGAAAEPAAFDYSFGPQRLPDGRVRFRLWAPGAEQVRILLDACRSEVMHPVGEGFYEAVLSCSPGTPYQYRIGAGRCVPDPASREQDGDVDDASLVPGSAYAWRTTGWRGRPWRETILYEVHVGLLGGFRGVQERLPDLAEMGITAIELMPIADFPGPRNWGYDGVLPYAPDSAYGGPDELRELVDTAHSLGVQVFLDVVYNHFGPLGNYLYSYAQPFFRHDIDTPWGAAIDFRRPQVRAFFAENALYWLREFRLDGLRLDAVHAIADDTWLLEMAAFVRAHIEPDRHVHLVLENDRNDASLLRQGFDAQWNDDIHHVLHHMLTGETQGYYEDYADQPARRLARCLEQGFDYQGESSPFRGGQPRGQASADLPASAFVFFLQNHDQTGNRALGERLATLCGTRPEALRAAIALQLLSPFIPLVFMGEEYGATAPFLYFTSFKDAALARAVSEGRCREYAGLIEAGAQLPDPQDRRTWDASAALPGLCTGRNQAWRALYCRLLQIRREHIVPHLDGVASLGARPIGPLAVQAAWRMGNGDVLCIYCNLSDGAIAWPDGAPDTGRLIFAGRGEREGLTRPGSMLLPQDTIATLTPRPK
jgi:maltooligosyltrehalose trehalohydrolase